MTKTWIRRKFEYRLKSKLKEVVVPMSIRRSLLGKDSKGGGRSKEQQQSYYATNEEAFRKQG